jgi:cobalamin biosynthesis Mg chelatase CobN
MHLLAATPGALDDGSQALDLEQTPADLVILSAAESELACLSVAHRALRQQAEAPPSLRLASLNLLGHNLSVDLYVDSVVRSARLVVVRVLGGRGYWPYGIDEISAACRKSGALVALAAPKTPNSFCGWPVAWSAVRPMTGENRLRWLRRGCWGLCLRQKTAAHGRWWSFTGPWFKRPIRR